MRYGAKFLSGLAIVAAITVQPNLHAEEQSPGATQADSVLRGRKSQIFGDGGTSSFYFTDTVPTTPGMLIRSEDISAVTLPSSAGGATRILYSSTDGVSDDRTIAVAGQILFPKGSPPVGGWPVVAWEHGTTGIADVCAPSWRGYLARDRAYLNRWLDEGFAIVATDYQGLGTPGPHPYLLYRPEGYSALDAVRAALKSYDHRLRNEVVLVGQSQGSGAALGAAWLAPKYAPEVHIIGVVATGLVVQFNSKPGSAHPPLPVSYDDPSEMDAAYAMLRVDGTDESLHPAIDTETVMTPAGKELSKLARSTCLGALFKSAKATGVSGRDLFTIGLQQMEVGEKEAANIPDARISIPIFAGTGLADFEASLPGQYNAVAAMCDAGSNIVWHEYHGLTHNGTVNGSLVDSIPFVKERLNGITTPGNCEAISVPGSVEAPTPGIPFNN
jgi:pimeloyl-ACP methyl ester carboxylesterase